MIYALDTHRPQLAADCWVADNATVAGQVVLGSEASVWFNAVLRGDVECIHISARSNLQDFVMAHADVGWPCTIGADVTVGHHAVLHGCQVGDGALIGIGATVLNGAVVGEQALLGAGALLPEGKAIPPRSLAVGAPAKVVRELSEAELAGLAASAEHYVANAKRFASQLKPC